jgi:hypothetical protein
MRIYLDMDEVLADFDRDFETCIEELLKLFDK